MVDPADVDLSPQDQQVAIALMNALVRAFGTGNAQVPARNVHRVIALMSAMVLEADPSLADPDHFSKAGAKIGELITVFAEMAREERRRTGVGLIELAAIWGSLDIN